MIKELNLINFRVKNENNTLNVELKITNINRIHINNLFIAG